MHFVITDYADKNVTKMRITFKTESCHPLLYRYTVMTERKSSQAKMFSQL